MKLKLIHNDGTVPSIFFPAGLPKDGGTCKWATPVCLERCWSNCNPNELEKWILNEFQSTTADVLANRLHMELLDRGKLFLQWFAWGDCLPRMVEKISWIIHELDKRGVTQIGFTRNKKLWKKARGVMRMAFTVEDKDEVMKYCRSPYVDHYGSKGYEHHIIAWPDYKVGETHLYWGTKEVKVGKKKVRKLVGGGSCGGGWYKNVTKGVTKAQPEQIFVADCLLCAKEQRGCFAKRLLRKLRDA